MKGTIASLPADAPQIGEVYRHYKQGDQYRVIGLAVDTRDDQWVVVYVPLYENPNAPLFTRPLTEWRELVEWEGKQLVRFALIPFGH